MIYSSDMVQKASLTWLVHLLLLLKVKVNFIVLYREIQVVKVQNDTKTDHNTDKDKTSLFPL